MAAIWYFRRDGATHGPYTAKQLKDAARSGAISPETEIRQADSPQWHRALSVTGLEFDSPPEAREKIEQFASNMLAAESPPAANSLPPATSQSNWQSDDADEDETTVFDASEYEEDEDDEEDEEDDLVPEYGLIENLARVSEIATTIIVALTILAIIVGFGYSVEELRKGSGTPPWSAFVIVAGYSALSIVASLFVWLFYVATAQLMRLFVQTAQDARRTRIAIERLAQRDRR